MKQQGFVILAILAISAILSFCVLETERAIHQPAKGSIGQDKDGNDLFMSDVKIGAVLKK